MNDTYSEFIIGVISLVFTIASASLIKYVHIKINALKQSSASADKIDFLNWVENDVIVKCIEATNQTYVNSLKSSGQFTLQNQKNALDMTISNILLILTESNKQLLSNYVGDISAWITNTVEKQIAESKKN